MTLLRLFFLVTLNIALVGNVWANDPPSPDMPEAMYTLKTTEPERDVGYTVGDKLSRHVQLSVQKPYQLIETTLPIVGYERRYRGQIIGIELRQIQHGKKQFKDHTEYTLDLEYQVFTNDATAKMAFLPAEILKFQGAKKDDIVQIRVPSWGFRVSPLAVFGAVKIEQDMSTYRPPFLIQPYPEKQKLVACLVVLGISLLALVYILGNRAWLPNMGKPFAKTYRRLRKLKPETASISIALTHLHQAMHIAGKTSIFSDNIEQLYQQQPALKNIDAEIKQFFQLSRAVFYENKLNQLDATETLAWLKLFCRRCRDCERGLKAIR